MVFWSLVRAEQEGSNDVADRTTGVAQRDSKRFLRVPWAGLSTALVDHDQIDLPPVFAAIHEKISGLQPKRKPMQ
jgi:hypothetical protein